MSAEPGQPQLVHPTRWGDADRSPKAVASRHRLCPCHPRRRRRTASGSRAVPRRRRIPHRAIQRRSTAPVQALL